MTSRLFLVDDQALFRQGLRALLAAEPDFTIVAEAGDAASAQDGAQQHRPDIVVMDVALAGACSTTVVEGLKRRWPAMRVLVLTAQRNDALISDSLRAGVDGYLPKDTSFDELMLALRSLAGGRKYLSPSLSGHLVETFLNLERRGRGGSPLDVLTNRERSILQLIAEGRSNRRAAEALNVSPKTIEKHRANLMRKLGLRNAGELLLVAVETGVVQRPGTVMRLVR